jgi:hypothetical protein
MAAWPDGELGLVTLFETITSATRAGTDTPADLAGNLPFLRVQRIGGPRDSITDFGEYDIDGFAATRNAARAVVEEALALLAPGRKAGSVVLDNITVIVGPRRLPWDNPNVRRWGATCSITARWQ